MPPSGPSAWTYTSPTGFSSVPPPGPAIPVTAPATSAPSPARAPRPVAAGFRERAGDRRLAHAEEAVDAPARRPGPREQILKGLGLERSRPEPLELRGRTGQHHDDPAVAPRHDEARCRPREPERERALRNGRLFRHARREVRVVALETHRGRARDGLDLPLEL